MHPLPLPPSLPPPLSPSLPQLPDNLTTETELALIYSLQNCHSPQEIIKCLVSYGVGTPGEEVQVYRVQNEHLTSRLEHLKSKNAMLANSFENAKANMEAMYSHTQKVEANYTRLLHALRCFQACEVYEGFAGTEGTRSPNVEL